MAEGKRHAAGLEIGYTLAALAAMNPYVKRKPTAAQLNPYAKQRESDVMFRTKDKRWLYKAFGVKPNGRGRKRREGGPGVRQPGP